MVRIPPEITCTFGCPNPITIIIIRMIMKTLDGRLMVMAMVIGMVNMHATP